MTTIEWRDSHGAHLSPRAGGSAVVIAALCAGLFAAAPAAAADGEVLINQARALAGGITPGDTAGFPITISRAGRYKLAGNLVVPADLNGIEVTASDVTVDLNGFTIRSNPPGEARVGIQMLGVERVRVVNGTITGFGSSGVSAGSSSAVIENMRLVLNGYGLVPGSTSRILNSTISNNAFDGVIGTGCTQCVVEQSVITGNSLRGVIVANGSLLLGNVIASNTLQGLIGIGASSTSGIGNNIVVGNNGGGAQTSGFVTQLHPNVCLPACP